MLTRASVLYRGVVGLRWSLLLAGLALFFCVFGGLTLPFGRLAGSDPKVAYLSGVACAAWLFTVWPPRDALWRPLRGTAWAALLAAELWLLCGAVQLAVFLLLGRGRHAGFILLTWAVCVLVAIPAGRLAGLVMGVALSCGALMMPPLLASRLDLLPEGHGPGLAFLFVLLVALLASYGGAVRWGLGGDAPGYE